MSWLKVRLELFASNPASRVELAGSDAQNQAGSSSSIAIQSYKIKWAIIMRVHRPSPGVLLITAISLALFLALPYLGWGSVGGLFANPVRTAAIVVVGLASLASLFTGINLGGCIRADAKDRWMLAPLALISLGIAGVPAHDDRHDVATIDDEATRLVGLVLLVVGAILRAGPMFVLGRRFTWPLASQRSTR